MSTHNMFLSRNKKNIMWIPPLICSYDQMIMTISCFGLVLSIFRQFSTGLLSLVNNKKWFLINILRKTLLIWMKFHISNDNDNILLRVITWHFS